MTLTEAIIDMQIENIKVDTAIVTHYPQEYDLVIDLLNKAGYSAWGTYDDNPTCTVIVIWADDKTYGNYYPWQAEPYPTLTATQFIQANKG